MGRFWVLGQELAGMSRWPALAYILSALLCLMVSLPRLSFSGDRSRLLEAAHPEQMRYEVYRQQFPSQCELVVLVHCGQPQVCQQAADWLAGQLRQQVGVTQSFSRIDTPSWATQGLYFLPSPQLTEIGQRLRWQRPQIEALAKRDWPTLWSGGNEPKLAAEFEKAKRSRGREAFVSPWGPLPPQLPISVELAVNPQTSVVVSDWRDSINISAVDGLLREAKQRYPQVQFTAAGAAWAQADDARRAVKIALQVTLTSVFLVHMFFRFVFAEKKSARLALLSVAVALAWTTAWVALVSPQLNLITINFAATLLGLGMDFHIQLLYRRTTTEAAGLERALRETRWESLTGAGAVSLAFASLTLLPYLGVAQLGKITSVGVLLCWVASRTVFPAFISWLQPQLPASSGTTLLAWESSWTKRPKMVLALAVILTLAAAVQAPKVTFDGNLLHMFSARSQTVRMEEAFHSQAGHCGLYAISLASDEKVMRARVEAFRKLPSVARVESLADWLPEITPEKRSAVASVIEAAQALPDLGPRPVIDEREMKRMRRLRESGGNLESELGPGPMQDALNGFLGGLYDDLKYRLDWLRTQRLEPQPSWSQVPPGWLQRYHHHKDWAIRIYPKSDIWDPAALEEFNGQLREIDPQVTGLACVIAAFLNDLRAAYWEAGRNALLAISLLLVLHFRSLRLALWGLAPKLLAMVWMLGAMGTIGLHFNPANVTALPLTLGIGLMFGIQVVHAQSDGSSSAVGLFASGSGKPILVSGLSTILGYISLCGADYPGVVSLGLVMALGVGCNLLAALVVMPLIMPKTPPV